MGIPPTGRQVAVTGITIDRVADGKVAEEWCEENWLALMQQLGVAPATA
jgi:predicted ester cyclase